MPQLKPMRDYNEKDVINLYTYSGARLTTDIINKGTLVKIAGDGWRNDVEQLEMLGGYGDFQVWNVTAQRYGTTAKVALCGATASDYPIGITLFDIRELDENLIPLKYNPRKAAELEACISGQTVPICTKGIFLYSGLTGSITPGAPIYAAVSGGMTANPTYQTIAVTGVFSGTAMQTGNNTTTFPANAKVGYALGATGVDGYALIRINL